MIFANSPLHFVYDFILNTPLEVRLGRHIHSGKPLMLWFNDGLMAVFFFLIGLEVKDEVLVGQLSSRAQIVLPGVAALGGMLAPAIVYVLINTGNSAALNGWAIPAATDIAFALGILALLDDRVPASLKIFLLIFNRLKVENIAPYIWVVSSSGASYTSPGFMRPLLVSPWLFLCPHEQEGSGAFSH